MTKALIMTCSGVSKDLNGSSLSCKPRLPVSEIFEFKVETIVTVVDSSSQTSSEGFNTHFKRGVG